MLTMAKMTMSMLLAVILAAGAVQGLTLPSGIVACPRSDPNYAECISRAIEGAIRFMAKGSALDLPDLDPLVAKKIEIKGNGGQVDLHQEYFDLHISQHTESSVDNVNIKIEKDECYIRIESHTPLAFMTGTYKFSGKMLMFTLNGHGNVNITLVRLNTKHDLECELYDKDGEDHVRIKKYNLDFNPEQLLFDLDNLIDGNPELSANVLDVMNENNKEIFAELKTDYEHTIGELFKNDANLFFKKYPSSIIFLD